MDMKALHRGAFQGHGPEKKPLFTQQHIKARLKFARDHLKHGNEIYKWVFWSDEATLDLYGHVDGTFVRWGNPKKC